MEKDEGKKWEAENCQKHARTKREGHPLFTEGSKEAVRNNPVLCKRNFMAIESKNGLKDKLNLASSSGQGP